MGFNVNKAKESGYTDSEIADYLSSQSNFDVKGARAAGYQDNEIINQLVKQDDEKNSFTNKAVELAKSGLNKAGEFAKDIGKRELSNAADTVDFARDRVNDLVQGAIALPESAVGFADMATGGTVGKSLENAGFDPKAAKQILSNEYSDAQKTANNAVQNADGFVDTVAASVKNPLSIASSVTQSLPLMGAGGVIGRGVVGLGINPVLAGAVGEGVTTAGQDAEQIRQQTTDGLLTKKQSAAAIAAGLGTTLTTVVGGKIAQKLGIEDIDTFLAGGSNSLGTVKKSLAKELALGGLTEGVLEEMPQSAIEQVFMNIGQDKPIMSGVGNAAATGLMAGAAMGGGAATLLPHHNVPMGDKLVIGQGGSSATNTEDDAIAAQKQNDYEAEQAKAAEVFAQRKADIIKSLPDANLANLRATAEKINPTDVAMIDAEIDRRNNLGTLSRAAEVSQQIAPNQTIGTDAIDGSSLVEDHHVSDIQPVPTLLAGTASGTQSNNNVSSTGNPILQSDGRADTGRLDNTASAPTQGSGVSESLGTASTGNSPLAAVPVSNGEKLDNEWTKFADESGTLNVPRAEMPQVKAENRGALVNFLNAKGIEHQHEIVPASSLKPTQLEYSQAKVDKANSFEGNNRSILISSDNHVLDGHHQWLAHLGKNESVNAIRLDAPIKELLDTVSQFPSATTGEGSTSIPTETTATTAPVETQYNTIAPAENQTIPAIPSVPSVPAAPAAPQTNEQEVATIGRSRNDVFSVKRQDDGKLAVLHNGEPVIDFDTEQDVTVPEHATLNEITQAIKGSGQYGKKIITPNKNFSPFTQVIQPQVVTPEAQQEPVSTVKKFKPRKAQPKSNTLLTAIFNAGGLSMSDKNDVTGENKRFPAGGYGKVFNNDSKRSLMGMIESGTLDDYLPDHMRLGTQTQFNSDAFDGAQGYDYLTERIRNGEKVLPYDVEQEIKANKHYAEDNATAQSDIESIAALYNEDQINEQFRVSSNQEREATAQAKQFIPNGTESDAQGSDGIKTRAEERRSNTETRKRIDQMSAEELRKEILVDSMTGLGNKRAYEESAKKTFQVSIDADALKWVNDNMGHAAGDDMLSLIGEALGEHTKDAYHVSGDEYIAQFDTQAQADAVMKAVSDVLAQVPIQETLPNGDVIIKKGVGFSYGIGKTLSEAENGLQQHKQDREQQGYRSARGQEPSGVVRQAAQRNENNNDAAANQEVPTRQDTQQNSVEQPKEATQQQENTENKPNTAENTQENQPNKADLFGDNTANKQALADAERVKDAKRNSGSDNQDAFTLTGSNSEADIAAANGVQDLFAQPATKETALESIKSSTDISTTEKIKLAAELRKGEITPADVQSIVAPTNTSDVGQELSGNLRNKRKTGLTWNDIKDNNETLKVAEVNKAKVFIKPDYDELVKEVPSPIIAHLVKQVYDAISAAPKVRNITDEDLKTYITGVNRVMEGTLAWAKNKASVAKWVASQARDATLLDQFKSAESLLDVVYPQGWKEYRSEIILLGGNKLLTALQPSYAAGQRANTAIKEGWPTKQEAWQKQGYKIADRSIIQINMYDAYTGKSNDMEKKKSYGLVLGSSIIQSFDTKAEAEAAKDNYKPYLLLGKYNRIKGNFDTREEATDAARELVKRTGGNGTQVNDLGIKAELAQREGIQHRLEGENISTQKLVDTFGFKGINFGTWMKGENAKNTAERQTHINHLYDGFMDLADILNVPPKALSLNGMLGIAIGAQGRAGAAAHFMAGVNEINLTREYGAGSLAHEFAHALDHYFAIQSGLATNKTPFLTENSLGSIWVKNIKDKSTIRPEIAAHFTAIVKAMNQKAYTKTAEEQKTDTEKLFAGKMARADNWINAIKRDFESAAKHNVGNVFDQSAFDNIVERINKLELGEGKIALPKASKNSLNAISPVVDEIRSLYKKMTGQNYPINNIQGLQSQLDVAKLYKDDLNSNYVPQQLTKTTDYTNAAKELDGGKSKPYWNTNLEKFARAFDAYVSDKLVEKEARNDYLSHTGRMANTVPKGEERTAINAAFDGLIKDIQTKESENGVVLFSRGNNQDRTPFKAQSNEAYLPTLDKVISLFQSGDRKKQQEAGNTPIPISRTPVVLRQIMDEAGRKPFKRADFIVGQGSTLYLKANNIHNSSIHTGKIDKSILDKLPELIADPIAVFKSSDASQDSASYKVLIDASDINGKPIIVAIKPNTPMQQMNNAEVHFQATIFPTEWSNVNSWNKAGDLRYYNEKSHRASVVPNNLGEAVPEGNTRDGMDVNIGLKNSKVKVINRSDIEALPQAAFNRSNAAGTEAVLAKSDVQSIADNLTKNWQNAPDIIVVEDMNDPSIRKVVRDENDRQLSQGATGQPEGFYDAGKVYVVASEMNSPADVQRVIFHEVLGHAGLRGAFGNSLNSILDDIYIARKSLVAKKATQYGLDLNKKSDRLTAAEEVLAEMAQTNPQLGFVKRAIAAIRTWLRNNGFNLKLSDDEIARNYLQPARDFIARGREAESNNDMKVAFSRTDPAPIFYSQLSRVFTNAKQQEMPAQQWKAWLQGNAAQLGVKADEIQWSGINDYLDLQKGKVSKADIVNYLNDNGVQVTEKELGNAGDIDLSEPNTITITPDMQEKVAGGLPMFSRSTTNDQGITAGWQVPENSKMDSITHMLQDKHVDLKRVTENIVKTFGELNDQWNAYLQEELYHGRASKRTSDFLKHELEPLINDMRDRKVNMANFEEFLWMRHAAERNAQIASINPEMQDGGSGINTQDAKDYLNNLSEADKTNYEALAKRVDAIIKGSNQVLLDYGLESKYTIAAWNSAYKHYVPLMREDMDTGFGNGTGQGFSVKGNSTKRALGSNLAVVDILANIAQQRERNIVRGEKNRVATSLIGLAQLNPNSEFWKTEYIPNIKQVGKDNQVESRPDPNYKSRPNVVVARILDKNGKVVEKSVVFNQFNERAMRMAASIKNLDADQMGVVIGAVGNLTRYFASINTQYNPIFGVVNLTRDIQDSLLNLSTTELKGKQVEIMKHVFTALSGVYKDLRAERAGKTATSDYAHLWEEFQSEGGQTGYRDQYKNAADRGDAIKKLLNPDWWQKTNFGKVITAGGVLSKTEQVLKDKVGAPVFNWLSDYNEAMENAVRLSAYKVALDNGMSKQKAASLAKNLTVNFNRKGQAGAQMGSLFAFFNASVQGTARLGVTLKGQAGKKIIAGGLTLGAMQAVLLSAAGFGSDDPPDFVKDRNIIVPIGNKKYLSMPMPLGFSAIPSLGRIITEYALSGGKNVSDRLVHLFQVFLDAANPVGGSGSLANIITPTIGDPIVDLSTNKDFTGRDISRQDRDALNPSTGVSRAKNSASAFSIAIAKIINSVTGGTDYTAGSLSPTPDAIDYLVGQVTGGVGREILKTYQVAGSLKSGEDIPTYKIPLVGKFYGDANNQGSQSNLFYKNITDLNKIEREIKGRRKDGGDVSSYRDENPEASLIVQAKSIEKRVSNLHKQKQDAIKKDASSDQIKEIEGKITERMTHLNDLVKKRKEQAAQ